MKKWTLLAVAMALPASAAVAAVPYGSMPSGFDRPEIRAVPIAGVYNQYWYNYKADILEAEKELGHSLRPYPEARVWLRDGFWARVYREFDLGVGVSSK